MIKLLIDAIKLYFQPKEPSIQKPKYKINFLLNAIGEAEGSRPSYWGGNPYDLVIGKRKGIKPVSEMTISEVKSFQRQLVLKGLPSGAVGKYQFINKTLLELQSKLKFRDSDVFSADLQDKMAMKLLDIRGLKDFLNDKLPLKNFMKNLSKEWASLPNPDTGKSYYGQRTHFTVFQMSKILKDIK